MSKYRAFTQESRDQILKSVTNHSTSKQAWSFSKERRFIAQPANCPYVSYSNQSTISNRKTTFGSTRRRVFTQVNEGPCSWVYKPVQKNATTALISFAAGRSEIIANTYIQRDPLKNPGPGRYQSPQSTKIGYSLRPKTANHRNYFIDDKEQALVPGPGSYIQNPSKIVGKNLVSKYKSSVLAGSMLNKSRRFPLDPSKTPSVWEYKKEEHINLLGKNPGSIIGHEGRPAFTDKQASQSFTPGPGNYKAPTEFAHYKKTGNYH